jgi:hypothetical protein
MAKRKAVRKKAVATRTSSSRAVSVRRRKTNSFNPTKAIFGGMVYGGLRSKVAQLVSPVTSKIPLGNYADEAVMGALSYFVAKGKVKFIPKEIGLAGLMIESAVIGQDVVNGTFAGGFGATQKTSSGVQTY